MTENSENREKKLERKEMLEKKYKSLKFCSKFVAATIAADQVVNFDEVSCLGSDCNEWDELASCCSRSAKSRRYDNILKNK